MVESKQQGGCKEETMTAAKTSILAPILKSHQRPIMVLRARSCVGRAGGSTRACRRPLCE
jgi:hypothetical protein